MKAQEGQREFFAANINYTPLLTVLAGLEIIFHTEDLTGLCFALLARNELITHQCFGCWRAVLAQPQGCLSNISTPICQYGLVVWFFVWGFSFVLFLIKLPFFYPCAFRILLSFLLFCWQGCVTVQFGRHLMTNQSQNTTVSHFKSIRKF